MSREIIYVQDEERICRLEKKIDELIERIKKLSLDDRGVGDWLSQEDALNLTGLGRTKLYELRKDGRIRSSHLEGKAVFYRRSDIEALLNQNEK